MSDVIWWVIAIYIAIWLLWWLWRPAPRTLLRRRPRPHPDAHDAAISVVAILGMRDGLHVDRHAGEDAGAQDASSSD